MSEQDDDEAGAGVPGAVEATSPEPSTSEETLPSGRRQAFRDLRRALTDQELISPGVVKLLLDELEQAECVRDRLDGCLEQFHAADKRAAVLEERVRISTATEILFAVGLSVGSALLGLMPAIPTDAPYRVGIIAAGVLLVLGSIIARVVQR